MDVTIYCEQRFVRTPDGRIHTPNVMGYSFWTRYLKAFDRVKVVSRVRDVVRPGGDWERGDGPGVSIIPLPYYEGPWEYIQKAPAVASHCRRAARSEDAIILRIPSQVASNVSGLLARAQRPFAVELVGDPHSALAPGSTSHPLRPLFRYWFTRKVRLQCRQASCCAYVTENVLQQRYPSRPGAYSTNYSSIDLQPDAYVPHARSFGGGARSLKLVTVASLEQPYKGIDILIKALALVRSRGFCMHLTVVGDGRLRPSFEALVGQLELAPQVDFAGQLPRGKAVMDQLDQSDVFVLASRAEGLPRAMLEAMARALPCVGSDVGGIPELLSPSDLVQPDPESLAARLLELAASGDRLSCMSVRNLEVARHYEHTVLAARRDDFFQYLISITGDWLRMRTGRAGATAEAFEEAGPRTR